VLPHARAREPPCIHDIPYTLCLSRYKDGQGTSENVRGDKTVARGAVRLGTARSSELNGTKQKRINSRPRNNIFHCNFIRGIYLASRRRACFTTGSIVEMRIRPQNHLLFGNDRLFTSLTTPASQMGLTCEMHTSNDAFARSFFTVSPMRLPENKDFPRSLSSMNFTINVRYS